MTHDSTPHASASGAANQAGSFHIYQKPPKTFIEQAGIMASRGMDIRDTEDAASWLSDVNYYRASGYWLTFKHGDTFMPGTSLDDIQSVYGLDSELRLWLWTAISRIEIKARTSFAYHLSMATGSAMAYENPVYFKNRSSHEGAMKAIEKERDRAYDEGVPCVRHNMDTYHMLPLWAVVEITSMGMISRMYGNLSDAARYPDGRTVRDAIAGDFDISPVHLQSWLRHLTYVRNLCAHHRRVYNRMMTTLPKLLDNDKTVLNTKHGRSSKRVFTSIVIIMRIFQRTWPGDWPGMARRLAEVIDSHPGVSLLPMGFPGDWKKIIGVDREPTSA